jgi:hypothetical protein
VALARNERRRVALISGILTESLSMKILTMAAAGAAALALAACTNPNPEETETAASMPDTSTAESPAPDAGDTGVAGPGAATPGMSGAPPEDGADLNQNLPPVDVPPVSN